MIGIGKTLSHPPLVGRKGGEKKDVLILKKRRGKAQGRGGGGNR